MEGRPFGVRRRVEVFLTGDLRTVFGRMLRGGSTTGAVGLVVIWSAQKPYS